MFVITTHMPSPSELALTTQSLQRIGLKDTSFCVGFEDNTDPKVPNI